MSPIQKGIDSASAEILLGIWASGGTELELKVEPQLSDKDLSERLSVRTFYQNPTDLPHGYFFYSWSQELDMKSKAFDAIDSFKNSIKNIKEVSKIAYNITENIITIWTFTQKSDRKTLYKIYNIEQKIIDNHPSLAFDFTVVFSPTMSVPSDMKIEII